MPLITTTTYAIQISLYRSAVLGDGATHFWRLGESSGPTAVDEKGTNNMTYEGIVSFSQTGLITESNTAVDFADTGGTQGSSLGVLSFPYTIEAWVQLDASHSANQNVFETHGVNDRYYGSALIILGSRKIYYQLGDSGLAGPTNRREWISTETLSTSTPHHIVAIANSASSIAVYIDGSAATMNPGSGSGGTPNFNSGVPMIGKNISDFGASGILYSDLIIDEVAFYANTALSSGQVSNHYTLGTT